MRCAPYAFYLGIDFLGTLSRVSCLKILQDLEPLPTHFPTPGVVVEFWNGEAWEVTTLTLDNLEADQWQTYYSRRLLQQGTLSGCGRFASPHAVKAVLSGNEIAVEDPQRRHDSSVGGARTAALRPR